MEEIFPLMSKLPAKYVIPYVTPSSDQANRGDCWLFATAGILESSYIHYGVCSRPTTEACTRRSTLAQSHLPRPPRPATCQAPPLRHTQAPRLRPIADKRPTVLSPCSPCSHAPQPRRPPF